MDNQIVSAAIQAGGSFAAGMLTMFGGNKLLGHKKVTQDARCERICANMVGISETLLAVMEAIAPADPRIAPHLAQLELRVADARAYLENKEPL